MFGHLAKSLFPTPKNLGRIILGAFFLITGVQSAMGFQTFSGTVQGLQIFGKNLPFPQALAAIAIGIKILGGVTLALDIKANWSRWFLIAFVLVATFFMHNPLKDSSQMVNMLKNMAIIGGLLLVE